MKTDALSMTPTDWRTWLTQIGEPLWRAAQIFGWLHKGVDFNAMSNLSKALRGKLFDTFGDPFPTLADKQTAADGTVKYLWELTDGATIESVAMRYKYGVSACLSSQVGCRMGCAFCATAQGGLTRNLTAGEILGQLLAMGRDLGTMPVKLVLMGMGEPLDNWNNVRDFLSLAHDEGGLNMSYRHMSLSTCGVARGLEALIQLGLPLTLSISLHAPDDATRTRLMPTNAALGVARLIDYSKMYYDETGRRISFEYVMIQSVTDSDAQARQLAALLQNSGAHVNLIALNPVSGSDFQPSTPARIAHFKQHLEDKRITVTLRRRLGEDIDAACGQLRARHTT